MRHTSFLLSVALTALVSACTTTHYKDRVVPVSVPVFEQPPEPAQVDLPRLPIFDLTEDSTDDEIAKAFVATAEILLSHAKQKEEATKPFEVTPDG